MAASFTSDAPQFFHANGPGCGARGPCCRRERSLFRSDARAWSRWRPSTLTAPLLATGRPCSWPISSTPNMCRQRRCATARGRRRSHVSVGERWGRGDGTCGRAEPDGVGVGRRHAYVPPAPGGLSVRRARDRAPHQGHRQDSAAGGAQAEQERRPLGRGRRDVGGAALSHACAGFRQQFCYQYYRFDLKQPKKNLVLKLTAVDGHPDLFVTTSSRRPSRIRTSTSGAARPRATTSSSSRSTTRATPSAPTGLASIGARLAL